MAFSLPPILAKVHSHPLIIFSQSDPSTTLRHVGAYDVHEQSESKHSPNPLSMACRYSANVCKIVCRWMSPHILHASFPNLSSVTVTSDSINCLPIIFGHRGKINLVISADDLPICNLGITFGDNLSCRNQDMAQNMILQGCEGQQVFYQTPVVHS